MPSSDALAVLVERNDPERTLVALNMLSTLLTKAREDAAKYGSIKSGSKALASKVLQLEGGVVALECIGFRLQDDAYVFDASAESEDVAAALAVFEAARTALLGLGDGNVPDVALAALKLVCIYAQNVVDAPDDASKRRVNAVNKALQSRVLSASGGRALLAAVGFEERAGGEAGGEAVFACDWADVRLLRVALGVLKRASDVWSAEAARSLGAPDAQAGAAEAKAAAPAEAVAGFNIRQLPPASRLGVPGAADMQPVLVLGEGEPRHTHGSTRRCPLDPTRARGVGPASLTLACAVAQRIGLRVCGVTPRCACAAAGGRSVELHTWSAPSKRWQLQGRMPIPSTAFDWAGGCGPRMHVRMRVHMHIAAHTHCTCNAPARISRVCARPCRRAAYRRRPRRRHGQAARGGGRERRDRERVPQRQALHRRPPRSPQQQLPGGDRAEHPHAGRARAADRTEPQGGHGGAELSSSTRRSDEVVRL